jgi:threonine dehydrogenase-like Zn-dependent dehydrogenase
MEEKVKAAVTVAPGKVEIQEFDMPKLGKGAAICKVLLAGVCGTDKHTYRGEVVQYKGTKDEFTIPFPIIQGHELVMEIAAIDETGAKNLSFDGDYLKVGDRVTICPDVVCGKCWYCKNIPNYPWCEKAHFHYGHNYSCIKDNHLYGGFSQYMYIEPDARLYKVPDGLPDELAAFTEVMCVTYSLEKAKEFSGFSMEGFNFGDTVVIQGSGPVGIAHVAMARMMGAGKIITTDISDYKLDVAKAFGADVTINVEKTTEKERIEKILSESHDGRGADICVECVGKPEVFPEGLKYLRKAGMYIELGNFVDMGSATVNVHEICSRNLRIIGMNNHTHNCYKTVMEMMLRNKDSFPWNKLFSHRYALKDTEKAIKMSMTKESEKVLIDPWA